MLPVASDVEAEPIVWEMFASRIVPRARDQLEDRDRHDGGRDGRGDGHPHAEAEVGVGGPEHDAEQHAGDNGLERELGYRRDGRSGSSLGHDASSPETGGQLTASTGKRP